MTLAGVILAAGGATRFDGADHKLLVTLAGRPLVCHAIDAAIGARLDETIVVSGAVDLAGVLPDPGITVLANDEWVGGIATSLATAVRHARQQGHRAIVVGLGDQPGILAEAWRAVATFPVDDDHPITVATYRGRRSNPVRLDAPVWDALPTSGDEGAHLLMRLRPQLVAEIPCPGDPRDIDTLEDLARWS